LNLMKISEKVRKDGLCHFAQFVYVHPLVEGLVELTATVVRSLPVRLLGLVQHGDSELYKLDPDGQLRVRLRNLFP
jgi:hypothetical protein